MKTFIGFLLVAFVAISCTKEQPGIPAENVQMAKSFDSTIQGKNFQIARYYSNTPIDYIDTDAVVLSETDLWPYVSLWIKDDLNNFNSATEQVTIQQGNNKIAGDDAGTITANYKVAADKDGVAFKFLNYQYQPLNYRLVSYTDSSFIVSATLRKDVVVYTEFKQK